MWDIMDWTQIGFVLDKYPIFYTISLVHFQTETILKKKKNQNTWLNYA